MSGGSNYNLRMTDSASPVVDLDLRLVGYFVVVAEQRHFGRAATVLRVAQHSVEGHPKVGDRLTVKFIMGQVTSARPAEKLKDAGGKAES